MARAARAGTVTLDDLRSFGREGLLQAARTFDPTRGVPFRRWANLRIKGAMIDGVRAVGHACRGACTASSAAIEAGDRMLEAYDEEDAAEPRDLAEARTSALSSTWPGSRRRSPWARWSAAPRENVDRRGPRRHAGGSARRRASCSRGSRRSSPACPSSERTLVERHYFGGETLDEAAASARPVEVVGQPPARARHRGDRPGACRGGRRVMRPACDVVVLDARRRDLH